MTESAAVKEPAKPLAQQTEKPPQNTQQTKPPQQQTMTDQPKYAKCKLDVHNLAVYKRAEYRRGEKDSFRITES